MHRIVTATALAAALALGAGAVHAASGSSPGPLWATVNKCDTGSAQNAMGVRASLPGDGSRGRMRVRFSAQWFSTTRGAWLPVEGVAGSPWLDSGSAAYVYQQAGWTFRFAAPPPGKRFMVRAVAEMQWLRGGRVVRSASRVTSGGVGAVDEGEPAGTSRGSCVIS